jgi:curved DNA-binding protein CbpA
MAFSSDWLQTLSDPYAVLGISIAADDKRILKQYRHIAKRLHPDRYVGRDQAIQDYVGQLVARVINPAYEKLKQEKNRAEVIALLRLQVKHMTQAGQLVPTSDVARELMRQPVQLAVIFYEQQVAALASMQYQSFDQIEMMIQQLRELNWVYLQLKMGDSSHLRVQRTGLISQESTPALRYAQPSNSSLTTSSLTTSSLTTSSLTTGQPPQSLSLTPSQLTPSPNVYAMRHYDRAQQYMKKGAYDPAIQELKDALRMEATRSEYHALLGYAYFCNNFPGMASVYSRQALKLNPDDPLAQKMAQKLNLHSQTIGTPTVPAKRRRLFGLFNR